MASNCIFLDDEAICSDPEFDIDDVDEVDLARSLVNFIDDTELFPCTPLKTPFETTLELNDELLTSVEKLHVSPSKSPPKKKIRSIQQSLLNCGEDDEGVYSYETTTEHTQQIEQQLINSEPFLTDESNVSLELKREKQQAFLQKTFNSISSDELPPRWVDVAKTMRSCKTMQKNWIIFCKKPLTGLKHGPKISHIALEAILCQDCSGIRAFHRTNFVCYILDYKNKSRSQSGLSKLLLQANVQHALIGVPFTRKPLVRAWAKQQTSVLSEESGRDVDWVYSTTQQNSTIKFNPEELIIFCEETEPSSIEILIANYRLEAQKGNENAQAWIEQCGAYNNAQHCYKMWKATNRGKQLQLSFSDYLLSRLALFEGGDAKKIQALLGFQGLNEINILNLIRKWFQGKAKSSTLCFQGPGNSGKSMLTEALIIVLDGCILSINEHNHFWKQGALGKRYCLIDDVTLSQWQFLDQSERRTLDGGLIAINKKFADSVETKMPPILITTNYYLPDDPQYEFLTNRLTWVQFSKPLPQGRLIVTPADVAAWLLKNKETLDIE